MPVPTKAEFQTATDLKMVISDKRAADTILKQIDAFLDAFHLEREESLRAVLLARIYYAAEGWMKRADRGEPGVNARRKSGVYAFYVQVVQELSNVTGVPINLLPDWLAETFGKAMVEHGADLDIKEGLADYLSEQDVRKFRLSFRGGLAYQQQWWTRRAEWVLASSANVVDGTVALAAAQGNANAQVLTEGFSGYVLSPGADFYTGPHFAPRPNHKGTGRYHSSYFGGAPVLSAGEIKIAAGRIVEINTNSGHYQPSPTHMRMAVETLALHGVSLDTIKVAAFGHPRVSGTEYLRLEGLNYAPVDKGLGVPRPGWAGTVGGNTAASRANVAATLTAHREVQNRKAAFATFKAHCAPVSAGGVHGPAGRGRCAECRAIDRYWDAYLQHVARGR